MSAVARLLRLSSLQEVREELSRRVGGRLEGDHWRLLTDGELRLLDGFRYDEEIRGLVPDWSTVERVASVDAPLLEALRRCCLIRAELGLEPAYRVLERVGVVDLQCVHWVRLPGGRQVTAGSLLECVVGVPGCRCLWEGVALAALEEVDDVFDVEDAARRAMETARVLHRAARRRLSVERRARRRERRLSARVVVPARSGRKPLPRAELSEAVAAAGVFEATRAAPRPMTAARARGRMSDDQVRDLNLELGIPAPRSRRGGDGRIYWDE